ncbi:MAG: glycine cleavage system aminomethyltransferase GcvT [Thermoplasmata archaeon]|nr:glycine cleavage system aminomethyltransferase GcvT [Thermoplasmata archaeon]
MSTPTAPTGTTAALPAPIAAMQYSPLAAFHAAHGGHMVPFARWEMPLYFSGILEEHAAVRQHVGLFDVSHMGILAVEGERAGDLLARRTTIDPRTLAPGGCRYGFWLAMDGKILDDLLITRLDREPAALRFLMVPNAARAVRVYDLLRQHRSQDTTIQMLNGKAAILAVQGPDSRRLLESTFGWSLGALKYYTARLFPKPPEPGNADGVPQASIPADLARNVWVSRTGYTGELGYELFVDAASAPEIAERIVNAGALPCGLGARDTLRLEKGYLLSGQDFHEDRSPLEAGQDRFVEFDHEFVGRPALEAQRTAGIAERLAGLEVDGSSTIPRHGTLVLKDRQPVGVVTSGGISPTLHHGLALAYLPLALTAPGTALTLRIRADDVPANVVPLPFLAPPKKP